MFWILLTKFKWNVCLIYIEDVIVYSKSSEENVYYVDEILSCLLEASVTLKIKNLFFLQPKVEYLGHIIKIRDLEIDWKNNERLQTANKKTRKTQLQSCLGLCNV